MTNIASVLKEEIVRDCSGQEEAAIKWCKNASGYAAANGGKPWHYVLIPHTAIAVNMNVDGLAGQFGC